MSRITITATDYGFYNDSPVGTPIAPNVFLNTGVSPEGTVLSFDAANWETEDSLRYDSQLISVDAQMDTVIDPKLGQKMDVLVCSVTYYRLIDGVMVAIGTLELPEPTSVTATYLSFGVDDIPTWQFDLGTAMEDLLKNQGFEFIGGEGDDVFAPHHDLLPFRGKAFIHGGAGDDQLTGTLGTDRIMGGTGDDVIIDDAGFSRINGGAGDDVITLGNGSLNSIAKGGKGDDTLISGWGEDTLMGKSGHDTLNGGRGDDVLHGNKGRDILDGGRGADTLIGGQGSDLLTGGKGMDVFVFNAAQRGRDTVTDFQDGIDTLDLRGVAGFNDLTIVQQGADTWITFEGDMKGILLSDTDAGLFDVSDFLFS